MNASTARTPVIAALAAVWVIWGSTYLAIKIGLETIPPFALQGFRFAIAGVALFAVLRLRGYPVTDTSCSGCRPRKVGALLLIGGIGLVSVAEDWGVDTGLVATLIAVQPMMMSLAGRWLGTWPQRREWIGMGVGLVGVLVLVARQRDSAAAVGGIGLVMCRERVVDHRLGGQQAQRSARPARWRALQRCSARRPASQCSRR